MLGFGRRMLWRMRSAIRRLAADSQGLMALKFALAAPGVVLLAVGAIDLNHVHGSKGKLQAIADAAALAGAPALSLATDGAAAKEQAAAYVAAQISEWSNAPSYTATYVVLDQGGQRALKVTLAGHRPSFFANLLPPGGWNFSVDATATTMGIVPLCVLITGESGSKLLNVKDSSRMNAPSCMVHSNRDILTEGGSITAAMVQAVTTAGGGRISPTPGTGAASVDDPFADLPLGDRDMRECAVRGKAEPVILTVGIRSLAPGVHCGGINVSGSATVILEPGEHHFLAGHLVVKENARLQGEDVVLTFDRASKFEFIDQAMVTLDGRKTGPYAGLVMASTRDNTQDFIVSADNVESLLGVIYVPNAQLIVEGDSEVARDSAWTVVVARSMTMKGSPSLFINANYGASDVPVPEGVGPRGGGSRLID